jgi:glycosyltransferase involved in cell wall biosynthesis
MSIDILCLTTGGRVVASTRYRVIYLRDYLKEYGINYSINQLSPININGLRTLGNGLSFYKKSIQSLFYDFVLIQKATLTSRELEILYKFNENILYDFDDAIYTTPPWESNENKQRKKQLDQTLDRVPYVIAGNPALAEYASKFCDTVFEAPTAIPKQTYTQYRGKKSCLKNKTILGWIGNEENLWYLKQIEESIIRVLSRNKDTELHIITSEERALTPLSDRIKKDVHYITWSEKCELEYLNNIDIGIRPLIHDEWSRAKGGFTSVIQCMGLEKPVVVTPVGMLKDIVDHDSSGFHADSPDEWIKYLEYLIKNPNQRKMMGKKAFQHVGDKRFWTEQRAADLASFYKSICK